MEKIKKNYESPLTCVIPQASEVLLTTDSTGLEDDFDAKENIFFFDEEEETVLAKPHTLWDDDENEEEFY